MKPFRVVLAGNPNAGKTTLFNALTSTRLRTGNCPGITVEQQERRIQYGAQTFDLVDLPGSYSLSGDSPEGGMVNDVLIQEEPDVVIDVVDASQLERHLYLTIELLELGLPVVLAPNLWDVALKRGLKIDIALLSLLLGVPVVPTIGCTGEGVERLLRSVARMCRDRVRELSQPLRVDYGADVEPCLQGLTTQVGRCEACVGCPRWCALKLLEGDEKCQKRFRSLCRGDTGESSERRHGSENRLSGSEGRRPASWA